jgi:predicted transcriptional regulator YdeE
MKNEEFKLIGLALAGKTTNQNDQSGIDCGNLWEKFEKEHFADRIPGKLSNNIYAVYYNYDGDHTRPFSYFIGCRIKDDVPIPPEMTQLVIPAGNFIKVVAKGKMPDCVANSWKDIWNSETDRIFDYDYEVYDERSMDWNNAEVDIFLSVK